LAIQLRRSLAPAWAGSDPGGDAIPPTQQEPAPNGIGSLPATQIRTLWGVRRWAIPDIREKYREHMEVL
jgi:hypothetical protein